MGSKRVDKYNNNTPGPGYYDNAHEKCRDASPAWK